MSARSPVYHNCNVCGRTLIREDELAIGCCAICVMRNQLDEWRRQERAVLVALGLAVAVTMVLLGLGAMWMAGL